MGAITNNSVGPWVGVRDGKSDGMVLTEGCGETEGVLLGTCEGLLLGPLEGRFVGVMLGCVDVVGVTEGTMETVGWSEMEGSADAISDGRGLIVGPPSEGAADATSLGAGDGTLDGVALGTMDGISDGRLEGTVVGDGVGSGMKMYTQSLKF